jgi:hypothetical protein
VAGRKARRDAEGSAQMHGQGGRLLKRRAAFPLGVSYFVTAASAHVLSDIAQQVEGTLEALVRITLGQQINDVLAALVLQLPLKLGPAKFHRGPVILSEVELFEGRIQLAETRSYPVVEGSCPGRHGYPPNGSQRCRLAAVVSSGELQPIGFKRPLASFSWHSSGNPISGCIGQNHTTPAPNHCRCGDLHPSLFWTL